jgi:hypothetical protein
VLSLILTGACSTLRPSPSPSSGQTPGQTFEQDVPPTLEFDTIELEGIEQMSPGDIQRPNQDDCPNLDSVLFQIEQASDPLELAKQFQLRVKEDRVQVLIVLDQEDASFLQDFDVEMGTQSGVRVQAFVLIGQLCDLANADHVLAVRRPAQAVP